MPTMSRRLAEAAILTGRSGGNLVPHVSTGTDDDKPRYVGEEPPRHFAAKVRCSEGNKMLQSDVVDVCVCDCFDGEERPGSRITTSDTEYCAKTIEHDYHETSWLRSFVLDVCPVFSRPDSPRWCERETKNYACTCVFLAMAGNCNVDAQSQSTFPVLVDSSYLWTMNVFSYSLIISVFLTAEAGSHTYRTRT